MKEREEEEEGAAFSPEKGTEKAGSNISSRALAQTRSPPPRGQQQCSSALSPAFSPHSQLSMWVSAKEAVRIVENMGRGRAG